MPKQQKPKPKTKRIEWSMSAPQLTKLVFEVKNEEKEPAEEPKDEFSVSIQVAVNPLDPHTVRAELTIGMLDHPEFKCEVAYNAEVSIADEVEDSACINAFQKALPVAIEAGLVPFIRETMANSTMKAGIKTFVLSPIYFTEEQFKMTDEETGKELGD